MAMCTRGSDMVTPMGLVLVLALALLLKLAMLIGMVTGMAARMGASNGAALTTAHNLQRTPKINKLWRRPVGAE
ncbi:hypothetical protein AWZ03_013868 [Drosophila navojoa]|uniref:Uncharacterized protein n=1 Tax=Drosophila navojoa TaxID=7232 RepID=A0A484AVS4_DRONA|nr:hypothetical protein AWZ03_013868 [Drosophila navojoa]